jgi:hypothetical protein
MTQYIKLDDLDSYNKIINLSSSTNIININNIQSNNIQNNVFSNDDKQKLQNLIDSSNKTDFFDEIQKEKDETDEIINNINKFLSDFSINKMIKCKKENKHMKNTYIKNINISGKSDTYSNSNVNNHVNKIITQFKNNDNILCADLIKKPILKTQLELSITSMYGWIYTKLDNHAIGDLNNIVQLLQDITNNTTNLQIYNDKFKHIFNTYGLNNEFDNLPNFLKFENNDRYDYIIHQKYFKIMYFILENNNSSYNIKSINYNSGSASTSNDLYIDLILKKINLPTQNIIENTDDNNLNYKYRVYLKKFIIDNFLNEEDEENKEKIFINIMLNSSIDKINNYSETSYNKNYIIDDQKYINKLENSLKEIIIMDIKTIINNLISKNSNNDILYKQSTLLTYNTNKGNNKFNDMLKKDEMTNKVTNDELSINEQIYIKKNIMLIYSILLSVNNILEKYIIEINKKKKLITS